MIFGVRRGEFDVLVWEIEGFLKVVGFFVFILVLVFFLDKFVLEYFLFDVFIFRRCISKNSGVKLMVFVIYF